MPAAPIVTGANLFRAKTKITTADLRNLATTPILLAPAMPGKSLMAIGVWGKASVATINASTSLETGIVYGPDNSGPDFINSDFFLQLVTGGVSESNGNDVDNIFGEFLTDLPVYAVLVAGTFVAGSAVAATVATPGLLYAPGDQGTIAVGNDSAIYTVLTVDGGGGVLTVSVSGGTRIAVGGPFATTVTTGIGDGNLALNITRINEVGEFEGELDLIYQAI